MDRYAPYVTRHPKLLASAIFLGSPITYFLYLHRSLSKTTQRTSKKGPLTASITSNISSIPPSALSSEQFMVYDTAFKSVPTSLFPALEQGELLTLYLRHTMCLFSYRLPQAFLLRIVSTPEQRNTFARKYIQTLDFKEGDVVCGLYRVVARTGGKVEMDMVISGIVQGGRLVISIEEKASEWVCSSETIMWKRMGEKALMPLEKSVFKWLHELASWWLLDSGTRALAGLRKES